MKTVQELNNDWLKVSLTSTTEGKKARSCYTCTHSLSCFLRIEFARTVQSFKLLAETKTECANTQTPKQLSDIWITISQACTIYEDSE